MTAAPASTAFWVILGMPPVLVAVVSSLSNPAVTVMGIVYESIPVMVAVPVLVAIEDTVAVPRLRSRLVTVDVQTAVSEAMAHDISKVLWGSLV